MSDAKRLAAEAAAELVEDGMRLGLGTGSTVAFLLPALARRELRDLRCIATSDATAVRAAELGIPVERFDAPGALDRLDLTIDGADEVDPDLNLIKGGGGALVREKIVAQASRREIIVVDEEKLSPTLGTQWSVPVEVLEWGWRPQMLYLESLGAQVVLRVRKDGALAITDQGNIILDCAFGPIANPVELGAAISAGAGVVGHGLFLGLATDVIVAGQTNIRHLTRPAQSDR